MPVMVSFQIVFKASHPVDSVKYTLHHLNVSACLIFTESWLGVVTGPFYAGSMSIEMIRNVLYK